MEDLLKFSEDELKKVNILLGKDDPSPSQAYDHGIAWIMACLSEAAYIKFNPFFLTEKKKDYLIKIVKKFIKGKKLSILLKLIEELKWNHKEEKKKLVKKLSTLKVKLIETFDVEDTQAILVSNNKFIALAFRGTETTSIKDIKTDTKAKLTKYEQRGYGRIHSGFNEAFSDDIKEQIQKRINDDKFQKLPLFITGHSLGGALATIAVKKLTHKGGIAACYTFGSPRVGDQKWITNINTPIYRLVNAADFVTMLPPGDEFITIFSWLVSFIPWFGQPIYKLLTSKYGGYLHAGNMRYLTNCRPGQYDNVELLYSVSALFRIKGFWNKKKRFGKLLADHSIEIYRKKLKIIAQK